MGVKFHAWWLKYGFQVVSGLGVVGMAGAGGLACWATYKSIRKVDRRQIELGREMTKKEKFKECWYFYIPAVSIGLTSGGCIIGASRNSAKVNAELAEMYAVSQASLLALKEKVVEVAGEKKAKAIADALLDDKIGNIPSPMSQPLIINSKEPTLFLDVPSGRWFKSDYETVKRAELTVDTRVAAETAVAWNEFFWEIKSPNLQPLGKEGQEKGFVAHGTSHSMGIEYKPRFLEEEGIPYLALEYEPEYLNWDLIQHGAGH